MHNASILISWASAFPSHKGWWGAINEIKLLLTPLLSVWLLWASCFKVRCIMQNEKFWCSWFLLCCFSLAPLFSFSCLVCWVFYLFKNLHISFLFFPFLGLKLSLGQRDFVIKNKIIPFLSSISVHCNGYPASCLWRLRKIMTPSSLSLTVELISHLHPLLGFLRGQTSPPNLQGILAEPKRGTKGWRLGEAHSPPFICINWCA